MSIRAQVPSSVIGFLREHVDSVVKLRFIVLLHDSAGGVTTVSIAARVLDVPRTQVRDMAHELAFDGLVRVSGDAIELVPASIDDRLAIADMAAWYARDRAPLLDLLRALGRRAS